VPDELKLVSDLQPLTLPLRGPRWLAGAVVTWRGHLTKLLTTPYERQEGWQLAASRFQGTLYLSEVETPAARAQRLARPPLLRELTYMGYKFEQYMCAGETCTSSVTPFPFLRD
jgi:RAT1-interacting protein